MNSTVVELFQRVLAMSFMGSVLAGVILLAKRLLGDKVSAAWHYYIWLLLLIRLSIPFAPESSYSIFNLMERIPQDTGILRYAEDLSASTSFKMPKTNQEEDRMGQARIVREPDGDADAERNASKMDWSPYGKVWNILAMLWATGALVMVTYTVGVNTLLHLRVRRKPPCRDEAIIEILKKCTDRLRLEKMPRIVYDSQIKIPMLFGFLKPRICIAPEMVRCLSHEELEHILLHELVHLKRGDILINWIMMVLQALHWFNPIVWAAFRRMKQDCELACDAHVLSFLKSIDRKEYGRTIINLLKLLTGSHEVPGTVGMMNPKTQTERRIMMIKNFRKASFKWTVVAILVMAVIGYVGLTNAKGAAQETPPVNEAGETVDIIPDASAQEEKETAEGTKEEIEKGEMMPQETEAQSVEKAPQTPDSPHGPQVVVEVDMEMAKNEQMKVDLGHSPWQLSPIAVTQTFVSLQISPEGITGEFPIKDDEMKIVHETNEEAIVEVTGSKTPIARVYLKRLVKQDETGIWSVVGYDPIPSKD
ncbi:MAG: M56 family metallopeptidase [Clostridia bacterium]|jgi:beta-lactamase regulating signal transducer with metallopeptidase domain